MNSSLQLHNYLHSGWRLGLLGILAVATFFLVVGFWNDSISLIPFIVLALILFTLNVLVFKICTYIRIDNSSVHFGQLPLIKQQIPRKNIAYIALESIPSEQRIHREWGAKGNPHQPAGFFMDVNSSTEAITITTKDNRLYKVGIGTELRGAAELVDRFMRTIEAPR
ncbi:hypothetical protein P4N68_11190 [Corynebacterium felinum]|uniref:Bacterial Pleckstrin homology domain-containing protein n=1 Tax=Corynebacterium felinum TaxID=131318 RepID=A0ABU2B8F6_9CORY|nr:hypothetical protein [Corynebacterium felinum]MDF5821639.1 hypothetical protein [Corynebacterium felinum]MDR7354681.1 hypothetical protein [Corynebacterium felinum]WJY94045.1 hypothetical protein CFELI_02015 [Corynebacterium felinum]